MINLNTIKYITIILLFVALTFGSYAYGSRNNKVLENYNRQLQGQLTDKEQELQSLNKELGTMRSDLMTHKELSDKLKKENEEYSKEFAAFIKKHKLEIVSRDKTIAELKQVINGGDSNVVVSPSNSQNNCSDIENRCVIQYSWQDNFQRFKLVDPNIFEKNNEYFYSKQLFKIYGEVYQQKDGFLQTRRLVLREIYKDENGNYVEIDGAKAEIIDAEFQYTNEPNAEEDKLFKLRFIALGSIFAYPNPGNTKVGLGVEFLKLNNFGLNTHATFDFQEDTELHIGLSYNPKIFGVPLNLAIGVAYGTPILGLLKSHSLSAGIIFYITN